jgi:hypothetical protein
VPWHNPTNLPDFNNVGLRDKPANSTYMGCNAASGCVPMLTIKIHVVFWIDGLDKSESLKKNAPELGRTGANILTTREERLLRFYCEASTGETRENDMYRLHRMPSVFT